MSQQNHTIHILNGPNLNLLGTREPEIYGTTTLADIEAEARRFCTAQQCALVFEQSNDEGRLVDLVQTARTEADGLIINAGAYSHTSVALRDALLALNIPIVEVHLSNIFAREAFRHHSYISAVAQGVICGLGAKGYILALDALIDILGTK